MKKWLKYNIEYFLLGDSVRYLIQFSQKQENHLNNDNWMTNTEFSRVRECQSNDASKIMLSFISICRELPNVVARHSIRIFDNHLLDWIVMTGVPDQFEPYEDPICTFWNHQIQEGHPVLEFKKEKSRRIY